MVIYYNYTKKKIFNFFFISYLKFFFYCFVNNIFLKIYLLILFLNLVFFIVLFLNSFYYLLELTFKSQITYCLSTQETSQASTAITVSTVGSNVNPRLNVSLRDYLLEQNSPIENNMIGFLESTVFMDTTDYLFQRFYWFVGYEAQIMHYIPNSDIIESVLYDKESFIEDISSSLIDAGNISEFQEIIDNDILSIDYNILTEINSSSCRDGLVFFDKSILQVLELGVLECTHDTFSSTELIPVLQEYLAEIRELKVELLNPELLLFSENLSDNLFFDIMHIIESIA